MLHVDLFAGAGGLVTGLLDAGVPTEFAVEKWAPAAATLAKAHPRTEVCHGWVHEFPFADYRGQGAVLTGGPPCQPFSTSATAAGRGKGSADHRDGWPATLAAVRDSEPLGFVFENVTGFVTKRFAEYRTSIVGELSRRYHVVVERVCAAEYGTPQMRHRVLLVGTRRGLPRMQLPTPTHGPGRLPFRTLRDTIGTAALDAIPCDRPIQFNRMTTLAAVGYDEPAHTLTSVCTDFAVRKPNGEVIYMPGQYRHLFQDFPDDYPFQGTELETNLQVGNAVPCKLGAAIGQMLSTWHAKL